MELLVSLALLVGFILGVETMIGAAQRGPAALLSGLFQDAARLGWPRGVQESDAVAPFRLRKAGHLRPGSAERAAVGHDATLDDAPVEDGGDIRHDVDVIDIEVVSIALTRVERSARD